MAGRVLTVDASVTVRGPLADGTADRVLQEWARSTARALGDEGLSMLRQVKMDKTSRARGGFQASLHAIQQDTVVRIPGPMIRGVTWGPWLEGSSKRNDSTRFRGYHLFRRTRQALQRKAPDIGERELARLMPQIGGK